MALQINYTDKYGNTLPESYWRIEDIRINVRGRNCVFMLCAYKDATCRQTNKQPLEKINVHVGGPEFETYYIEHITKQKNLAEIGYAVAKAWKNNGMGGDSENVETFFNGAVDV